MKTVKVKPDERFARLLELSSSAGATEDPAMASLLNLTSALRVAGQAPGLPTPDPDFRAALRQRLVAVATVQEPATATHGVRSRTVSDIGYRTRRRLAALAGTFAIATSVAGVGVAAAHSLPGDPFYGVKRATESVQLWTTRGEDAKGKRHLQFARERLAEAKALPVGSSHTVSTLAAMDSQTTQGAAELIATYDSTHSTAPLADLLTFSRVQTAGLAQLAVSLTPAARAAEAKSLLLVQGVVVQVRHAAPGVCIICAPGIAPTPTPTETRSPSPSPHKSAHPSKQPSNGASAPAGSSSHPSTGASPRHSNGLPTSPPTSLLPTHAPSKLPTHVPTKLPTQLPTKNLQSTLNHHKPSPLPIVSSVLGGLGH